MSLFEPHHSHCVNLRHIVTQKEKKIQTSLWLCVPEERGFSHINGGNAKQNGPIPSIKAIPSSRYLSLLP